MKKKLFIGISFIVIAGLFTFNYLYNNRNNGKLICTNIIDGNDAYMVTRFDISFKNHAVTKVYSVEKIEPTKQELVNSYYSLLKSMYDKYNDLDNYDNELFISDSSVVSKTNINYDKIDSKKFIEISEGNKKLYTNNKVLLKTLRKQYEKTGCTCKFK